MVDDPSSDELIRWSDSNSGFVIIKKSLLVKNVIPAFIGKYKFHSFRRKLSKHCFTKVSGHGVMPMEYYHPLFVRGSRNLELDPKQNDEQSSSSGKLSFTNKHKQSMKATMLAADLQNKTQNASNSSFPGCDNQMDSSKSNAVSFQSAQDAIPSKKRRQKAKDKNDFGMLKFQTSNLDLGNEKNHTGPAANATSMRMHNTKTHVHKLVVSFDFTSSDKQNAPTGTDNGTYKELGGNSMQSMVSYPARLFQGSFTGGSIACTTRKDPQNRP